MLYQTCPQRGAVAGHQYLPAEEELARGGAAASAGLHVHGLRSIDAALGRIALEHEDVLRPMAVLPAWMTVALSMGRRGE